MPLASLVNRLVYGIATSLSPVFTGLGGLAGLKHNFTVFYCFINQIFFFGMVQYITWRIPLRLLLTLRR